MTAPGVRSGIAKGFVVVLLWFGLIAFLVVSLHAAVWLWDRLP